MEDPEGAQYVMWDGWELEHYLTSAVRLVKQSWLETGSKGHPSSFHEVVQDRFLFDYDDEEHFYYWSDPLKRQKTFPEEAEEDDVPAETVEKRNPSEELDKVILRVKMEAKRSESGFRGHPIVESIDGLKASFVVRLYPSGFALDPSQRELLSYDSPAFVDILRSIDTGKLSPDLLGLVHSTPCHFYEGSLVVELRDFRKALFYANAPSVGSFQSGVDVSRMPNPDVVRVLLRPDDYTVTNDVSTLLVDRSERFGLCFNETDVLKLEGLILEHIQPPLCLEPDPRVAQIANSVQYNHLKFTCRPFIKRRRLMPHTLHVRNVPELSPTEAEAAISAEERKVKDALLRHAGALGISEAEVAVATSPPVPRQTRGRGVVGVGAAGAGGTSTSATSVGMSSSRPRLLRLLAQRGWLEASHRSALAHGGIPQEIINPRSVAVPHHSHSKLQVERTVLPTQVLDAKSQSQTPMPYREPMKLVHFRATDGSTKISLEIVGLRGILSFQREDPRRSFRGLGSVEDPQRLWFSLPSRDVAETLIHAFGALCLSEKYEYIPPETARLMAQAAAAASQQQSQSHATHTHSHVQQYQQRPRSGSDGSHGRSPSPRASLSPGRQQWPGSASSAQSPAFDATGANSSVSAVPTGGTSATQRLAQHVRGAAPPPMMLTPRAPQQQHSVATGRRGQQQQQYLSPPQPQALQQGSRHVPRPLRHA